MQLSCRSFLFRKKHFQSSLYSQPSLNTMLSLQLSLAAILATASAGSLSFETDATLHDYMSYSSGVADSNPPWCEVSYASLDLSSVTAYGSVTKDSCGDCLEVCGSTGCKHLLVIDQCSRGDGGLLDISTGAGQQICGAITGHCSVTAKAVDASHCSHIWDGKMFFPYTPFYGGFSKLKQIVDGKGGAAAGSSAAVETSTPLPTSTVAPTFVPVQTFTPVPVQSSSSSPAPVFTPPTTSSSTPVGTSPAVVSSSSAYTPPAVSPPFPFTNSTVSAASAPTAPATGVPNYCPRPAVTKTITPTTTVFITVSGTPIPIVTPVQQPTVQQPEEEQPEPKEEPPFQPTPEEENEPEQEPEQQPGQNQPEQQPQPPVSTPELTTTNILRATQTLQVFTTLTTRVVNVQSVFPTAPTAPAPSGVPLSTGSPGQGWNSTSSYGGSRSGSGSGNGGQGSGYGYERRAEHLRGHVKRGGSVRRNVHGGHHAHGHARVPGL